jgi:hypothetical protein
MPLTPDSNELARQHVLGSGEAALVTADELISNRSREHAVRAAYMVPVVQYSGRRFRGT